MRGWHRHLLTITLALACVGCGEPADAPGSASEARPSAPDGEQQPLLPLDLPLPALLERTLGAWEPAPAVSLRSDLWFEGGGSDAPTFADFLARDAGIDSVPVELYVGPGRGLALSPTAPEWLRLRVEAGRASLTSSGGPPTVLGPTGREPMLDYVRHDLERLLDLPALLAWLRGTTTWESWFVGRDRFLKAAWRAAGPAERDAVREVVVTLRIEGEQRLAGLLISVGRARAPALVLGREAGSPRPAVPPTWHQAFPLAPLVTPSDLPRPIVLEGAPTPPSDIDWRCTYHVVRLAQGPGALMREMLKRGPGVEPLPAGGPRDAR